jgi:hypothetical protein
MRARIPASVVSALTLALAACSAIVQPDPGRLGGHDAGRSIDAFVVPGTDAPIATTDDAFVVLGDDAPLMEPDAYTGEVCGEPCTDGTVCVGGECLCPEGLCCPGCADREVCVDASCEDCGGEGEWCCRGGGCESGTTCEGDRCEPCGGPGERCCAGSCRDGVMCNAEGVCATECGVVGQPCCEGRCFEGRCRGGFPFGEATCQACGGRGQECCDGACDGMLTCSSGTCRGCGTEGEPCCGGTRCDGDLVCNGGRQCEGCGGRFEGCCPGNVCREGSCTAGSICL